MKKLIVKELIFLLLISCTVSAQDGKFSFTLSSPLNTSAGVYESDSILVRTLWNNVKYSSGTYTKYWDGKDDQGNPITSPAANYTVKVLRSNVNYQWQGTIGNSSDSMTGDSKHRGYYYCMRGLAFGPNYGYFCTGYSEGSPSVGKFLIASPNTKISFLPSKTMTANTDYVATDGVCVYWGAYDAFSKSNSFVYGTRVSDDSEFAFSSGVSYAVTYGKTYSRAISILNQNYSAISGLAVQKNGNFLFVARSGLDQLQVLDKTTGALLQTLTYSTPRGLCVDANGNLWMATGTNAVEKYTVNSNGTLSTAILTLTGLTDPLATQVSADGTLISVADGANSQQVKFFNNNTGASTSTLGVAGGYFTDASVNDNKFYFNDARGNQLPFIAFQYDGSFWVNDPGNFRVQHYSGSRNFINRVMSLGATYAVTVDRNNIKRAFANYLEFNVDYSIQNLSGKQGWTLVKNWGANVTSAFDRSYYIRQHITLSNGRTYGIIRLGTEFEIVEFPATGQMRFTGVMCSLSKILCNDGAMQDCSITGATATYMRYPLAGFDAAGNPSWSKTPEILAVEKTDIVVGSPVNFPNTQIFSTTNKVVFYNPKAYANNVGPVYSTGCHLGIASRGTTGKFLFTTEKSTHRNYAGEFPESGWFDEGNLVNDFAGGNVNIVDRNIITSYHGEFWKNSQTNYYNHYYDNGLAIGQFGTDRIKVGMGVHAAAMMAGNALTPIVVKDSNGDLYLYHGDESDHSGVHRWKISGLNTIAEDKIVIPYPSAYITAISMGNDLMTGLPFSDTLVNNSAGWTRTPVNDILTNKYSDYWNITTGVFKFNPLLSTDVHVLFANPSATDYYLNRDLGNNNVTNDWSLNGKINFKGRLNGGNNNYYIEVLDDAAKVLTTFYGLTTFINYPIQSQKLLINSAVVLNKIDSINGGPSLSADFNKITDFNISVSGGKVTFTYGNYAPVTTTMADLTANWRKPKTVRIHFKSNGTSPNNNMSVDISDFMFAKDTTAIQVSNQAPIADAGVDHVITLPVSQVKLNGNGIDNDGTVVSYAWAKISGPAAGSILTANKDTTTISGLIQGIYQYALTVTDNKGAVGSDTVKVTVNAAVNQAPVANAGADQSITLPVNNATLIGAGTDSDGTIAGYIWRQISGPSAAAVSSTTTAVTVANNLLQGQYQFELTVTDNNGAIGKDTISITVNKAPNLAPTSNAGVDQSITLPINSTTLAGIGTDPDGTISGFSWSQIAGPSTGTIVSPAVASTLVSGLLKGIYDFVLTVTDNNGAFSKDTIRVTVNDAANNAPTANAGTDQVLTLPTALTTLNGSGTDTDGTIAGYTWTKISGPSSALILSPANASTVVNNWLAGVYEYELVVTDNKGAIGKDTVQVTVLAAINVLPVANAGIDQVITLPQSSTTLSGTGADSDGFITNYAWAQITGPTTALISSPVSASSAISNLSAGVYQFELSVTDNTGAISKDTVSITVNPVANQAPTANAGVDQVITLPTDSTILAGNGIDSDGVISGYSWTQIGGPSLSTIIAPTSATTTIKNLVQGVYVFEIKVIDDKGASSTDSITVTVNDAPNQAPVSDAGPDQVIVLPINSVTFSGNGFDADGSITSYAWVKISGPATGTIATPGFATTQVNNLDKGVYQFELTVTDNKGATSADSVQVTVNDPVNQAPVANAGGDQVINLPINSTTLTGSATDVDGTIAGYAWSKISGPLAGTISSSASATTAIDNLVAGVYEFRLTVTDDDGALSSDTIMISVVKAPNQVPVADAGTDQSITLPVNSTTLTGSGIDFDGTIASYSWNKISGPVTGTISSSNSAVTSISNLSVGIYQYELTVTDNDGASSADTITVIVNPAPNQVPVANAGTNKVITLPVDSTILSGTGIDADGTIINYTWTQLSGPATCTIASPASAATSVYNLVQGLYELELSVTDNDGAVSKDTVQITVNDALNIAPVAVAGTNQVITLPVNSTMLTGIGTDSDGLIAGYSWTKISGPAAGTIATANTASTLVDNLVQGIYKFELTVTDDDGAIAKDIMQITVNAAPNLPPVANAGADQVITLPVNSATLTGSGTDTDGTISSYKWTKISGSGGNISSSNAATATISNLVQGIYLYRLTVKDDSGASASDTIQVTVIAAPNQAPVANAGSDIIITLPTNFTTLNGSATDVDGSIASYTWTKISGIGGNISTPNSGVTSLTGLASGIYQFELIATDNDGAYSTDTLMVTVNNAPNQAPTSNAGNDQVITLPVNNTVLNGVGFDADGTIAGYAWSQISGPAGAVIVSPNSANTTINNMVQGTYLYQLIVTDNDGAIASDTILVLVNAALNVAPVVNAGSDQVITLPVNSTTLSGTATDSDGTIVDYTWVKISGPAAGNIASPTTALSSVNSLVQGLYEFELTVTDNDGAVSKDTVQVTVNDALNQAPIAIAGTNQVITLPTNAVTLTGAGTDADGTVVSYSWIKISGPAAGSIVSANTAITSVNNLVQGIYKFELTVTDDDGAISKDVMQVTVNKAPNQAPVAIAGSNQVINLPANSTTLIGNGTDADGTIIAYNWVKISGPAFGVIVSPNNAATQISNLVQGVYLFQLTVTDNDGASSIALVQVTVNAAPNQSPVANAGSDIAITLPVDYTSLNGTAVDPDGTIASYAWVKISGPVSGSIASPNSGNSAATGLAQGVYLFELTVKDNLGAIAKDTVQVTVNAAPNQPPSADAGSDQAITLPVNSTTLSGIGTDADGTISNVQWVKISGPAAGNIALPNAAITNINSLVQGVYNFELAVTDDDGAIAKDTVKITVNPAPNQAPVAFAGNDKVITLPVNTTTLSGSGTDTDGFIAGYSWVKVSGPAGGTIVSPNGSTTNITNLVQGIYQFELTVTDDDGAISRDIVQVIVNKAPNQTPVANAGIDQAITLPINSVTLIGTATDADGTITNYKWGKISGPASGNIITANAAGTLINNLVQGVYQFQLTVTDNDGASSSDVIQVTVKAAVNIPPVANAGVDKLITLPVNSTTLTGSGIDIDGTVINYAWVKISGPASGTISTPGSASTSINNLVQGVYQYQLIVTDNSGAVAMDTVKVTVNAAINIPPVANAGLDKVITLPTNSVTVTGSGTDADGTISGYVWSKISGPAAGSISSTNSATTAINNLIEGIYYYQFTVTDNSGAKSSDTIKITVNKAPNQAPVANAGVDKMITLPVNTTTLSGIGTDADGTVVSFAWVKISGPATGSIALPTTATTTLNNLVQGTYQYQLTVTDNDGAISKDTVKVTVNPAANKQPVANAGVNQVITLPVNSTTLTGSGTDADGTITGYKWTKVSGPVSGNIVSPNNASTIINNLAQGIYQYAVTVTDNSGATATDTIQITVNKAPNKAPVANAGVDKVIMLPTSSTTLSGSGSDADGTVTSYKWTKISGPAAGNIASPTLALTAINNLGQGVYQFELTVTDNDGAIGKDTVQVTVNAPSNLPPVANAGPDKVIVLPVNSTVLTGSGVDADGVIMKYEWVKISGPATGTIALPNSGVTVVSGLVQGVYQYELTVTDNGGKTATDTVKVTVNAGINLPPVANAGPDVYLVLPDNFTSLIGTGTDTDGTIASYLWKVVKGPAGYSLPNADQSKTQISNLFQGIYEVELTVVDNYGLEGKDTMTITVSAPRLSNLNNEAKIYPNPVKDIATVDITTINANSKLSVSVINAIGMQIKYHELYASGNTTLFKLDMSNLSDAYYFVVVRFDDGSKHTFKILKSASN
ncbi:MAG: T9SS type A sorting domain-containing protein [Ferruginibacter sp.]